MTLTVCGLIGSPFYRKILTQLNEKNIGFETEMLNPFKAGDEFTAVNPARRIPLLKDSDNGDDWILPDSSAIFHYIERKTPEPSLLPKSPADYGRALWLEEYADSVLASTFGLGVFRRVVFPQMQGKPPETDAALDVVRSKLPDINDYVEAAIGDNDWFAGPDFSVADISIAVQYANLSFAGYVPSASRWPRLIAFMRRIGARDSFAGPHMKAAAAFADMEKLTIDPGENL